jgi:hypothetical protein
MVDSELFIDKLAFSENQRNSRNSRLFDPPRAKTNLGPKSPFYRILNTANLIELQKTDLTNSSLEKFKKVILMKL